MGSRQTRQVPVGEWPSGTRRGLTWLLAGGLLAGCQASGPCQLGLATEVPLRVRDGHLLATPLLNGQPTNMWFDTGAQITTLATAAADRLSLSLIPLRGTLEGVGGSSAEYGFVAGSFQIGRLRGHNFQLIASDLGASRAGPFSDGLLGADFLSPYDVDLDIAYGKAILFKTTGDCASPSAALSGDLYTVPMRPAGSGTDPRPHINVQVAGKTLTALLDTGAPTSLLFRDAARRIGLQPAGLVNDPRLRAGGVGSGTAPAVRHVLGSIEVGDLTVSNLPVVIIDQAAPPDADMLLGLDFFFHVHTWLSFSSRSVVLQYPPLPSPAAQ